MATPKYAERVTERVAVLETKFDALKDTVEDGFRELGEKLDAASLNGQTPRVKHMSARLGDPEDVAILAEVVESHKRRAWLFAPVLAVNNKVVAAALWVGTAAALAALNGWIHATFSTIP